MSTIGCYVLHVYCDDPKHVANTAGHGQKAFAWHGHREYTGRSDRACMNEARRDGWKFRPALKVEPTHGGVLARCPICQNSDSRPPSPSGISHV